MYKRTGKKGEGISQGQLVALPGKGLTVGLVEAIKGEYARVEHKNPTDEPGTWNYTNFHLSELQPVTPTAVG